MLIKTLIATLSPLLHSLTPDKKKFHDVLSMENSLALAKIKQIFETYRYALEEITPETAKPFTDCLAERWEGIQNTDAIYSISARTPANTFYHRLAVELGLLLAIDPMYLLMPTLKAVISNVTYRKLEDMKPHEYVMTDNNDYPIEVLSCLEDMNHDSLYLTHEIQGERRELTETERARVIYHSKGTDQFYHAKSNRTAQNRRAVLEKELNSHDYKLTLSYGEAGQTRLQAYVFSRIHELFTSRDEFILFMNKSLPKDKWKSFLEQCDKGSLEQLILRGTYHDKFAQVTAATTTYTGEEAHDKAVLFCLAEVYWKDRSSKGEYTSTLGWLTGMGYAKVDKQKAIERLQEFLATDLPLKNFPEHLKQHPDIQGPLFNGYLKAVAEQVPLVSQLPVKTDALQDEQRRVAKR